MQNVFEEEAVTPDEAATRSAVELLGEVHVQRCQLQQ